jgi:pSer/pThr/pTyr-binding forkhead associated (FHA) protein
MSVPLAAGTADVPEIAFLAVKMGVLALLWLFVLAVVRALRLDVSGAVRRPPTAPATTPSRQAAPAPRGRRARTPSKLVVTDGALRGTTLPLGTAQLLIGRADDSTLVLTDDYVSNRHARLWPHEGQWLIEDLGSTNGTYLDRSRVTAPVPVPLGAPIRIGKTVMELRR